MICFDSERALPHLEYLIGSDEVGRGPLAGPVVACSVGIAIKNLAELLTLTRSLGVTDSKKLSAEKRIEILEALSINHKTLKTDVVYQMAGAKFCLNARSPEEIDKHNILKSSLMAMETSRRLLQLKGHTWWMVDGNKAPLKSKPRLEIECVIEGDQKSQLIGLASIIAKSYRDFHMEELALLYPGYGFERHAGYATAFHRQAIMTLGPSPIHRRTFKGVKEYVAPTSR